MNVKIIKKLFLICILMIIVIMIIPKCILATDELMLGDINNDKVIDSKDLLLITRHVKAKTNSNHNDWILKDEKLKAADVTQNGVVNAKDIIVIVKYIAASNDPEEIGKKHPEWLKIEKKDDTSTPDPIPEPVPTPEPTPDPEPTPEPVPTPEPIPDSDKTTTVDVKKIKINKVLIKLAIEKEETLTATIEPSNATNKKITWSSANTTIATVDENGKVTGKLGGTTTITAKSENGKTATCVVTVEEVVKKIIINKTKITLDLSRVENSILPDYAKTEELIVYVLPSNAANKKITWSSANTTIATVDENGKVTAKSNGTTTITAKSENGKIAVCIVTVITSPTAVELDKSNITLEINKTETIKATVVPNTATNKTVTFSSNNAKVATVDENGKVTAKGNGTTTITAKSENGKTAVCTVTVKTSPTAVKLDKTKLTLDINKTATIKATVVPNTATNKTVTFSSNNAKVATVDKNGKVTAKAGGKATITAKTSNGKTATCVVTVNDPKITGGEAIAEAAVKLACTVNPERVINGYKPNSRVYNNRTKAYVDAREKLIVKPNGQLDYNLDGGDYASCDIAVAIAVRYSGTDKIMEFKTIPNMDDYLDNSKSWVSVGTFNGTSTHNLQSGDVLINSHHIFIYAGNKVVRKKYPNSNTDSYEANYSNNPNDSFYPRLFSASDKRYDDTYTVFRHVNANKKMYNKILK